jgi:hypothetical protein
MVVEPAGEPRSEIQVGSKNVKVRAERAFSSGEAQAGSGLLLTEI